MAVKAVTVSDVMFTFSRALTMVEEQLWVANTSDLQDVIAKFDGASQEIHRRLEYLRDEREHANIQNQEGIEFCTVHDETRPNDVQQSK